ncbi:integrating conjugative element protein [Vibrio tubiashii]|uniref:PFL_4695 family integrating conjugative element protein n=1 Tax=Vibrio tubiashii TaxID=29498 RepID=UPI001EFC4F65|nr:integrating conjugative element protein [Vibrio tubiashii]MCG9576642.1 integrating conjugative element protein [Vibrio tubiashii]
MRRMLLAIILVLLNSQASSKELTVLVDAGGQPLEAYIDAQILDQISVERKVKTIKEIEEESARQQALQNNREHVKQRVFDSMFPIETYSLAPMTLQVDIERHNPNVIEPMAIIGDDKGSKRWVAENKKVLRDLGARLVIVEAKNAAGVQYYKNLYKDMKVSIRVGDKLKEQFGIPGYPVLLTNQGIYQ